MEQPPIEKETKPEELLAQIKKQGDIVRGLKSENGDKDAIAAAVESLLGLKEQYTDLTGQPVPGQPVKQKKKKKEDPHKNDGGDGARKKEPKVGKKEQKMKSQISSAAPSGANHTPWPSIDNYLLFVTDEFEMMKRATEWAAVIIQRSWRAHKEGKKITMVVLYYQNRFTVSNRKRKSVKHVCDMFLTWNTTASIKYDGTNVGTSCDGSVYGRRLRIDETANRYQSVPLDPCRQVNASKVKQSFVSLFSERGIVTSPGKASVADMFRLTVYGELMCNRGLYDYQEAKLAERWLCFGIRIRVLEDIELSDDELAKFSNILEEQGFIFSGVNTKSLTIVLNEKLEKFLVDHGIEEIASYQQWPSQAHCIANYFEYMVESKGEGLIIYIPGGPERSSAASVSIRKWKIAKELSKRMIENFTALATTLTTTAPFDQLLPAPLSKMLTHLNRAANAPIPQVVTKKQKKANRGQKFPEEVVAALNSALTKYDSMEEYFEKLVPEYQSDDEALDKAVEKVRQDMVTRFCGELLEDLDESQHSIARECVDDYVLKKMRAWKGKREYLAKKKLEEGS